MTVNTRFTALIGTGGIGSGMFAALEGDHTLGREESRAARFLDRRDYCKGHIICHTVHALMGPAFPTILIGKVGGDVIGARLLEEMRQAGLDNRFVEISTQQETLFSVVFLYPDGSGGNITSANSASSVVDPSLIARAEPEFARYAGNGIALAAPEVPLDARRAMLELASRHRFFRAASFVSAEIREARALGMFADLDLIALNLDEAAALLGRDIEGDAPEAVVEDAVRALSRDFSALMLSITAGKRGSWCWDGVELHYQPAFPAQVASAAGAGDAHLAGMLAGIASGLSLAQSQEIGALTGALSVESPHTIAPEVGRSALRRRGWAVSAPVQKWLDQAD